MNRDCEGARWCAILHPDMEAVPACDVRIDLRDPKCFESIYNAYWKKVYTQCYRHTNDSDVAEEMAQDIFKSLWERRHELTITVSLERYLARAAKFKVFEFIRNKTTKQLHVELSAQDLQASSNCTENDILFNALKEDVETVVEGLPAQCKRVFRLSRAEGLSNREIAAHLEVSERAVEQHITRALRSLRQVLLHEPVRAL